MRFKGALEPNKAYIICNSSNHYLTQMTCIVNGSFSATHIMHGNCDNLWRSLVQHWSRLLLWTLLLSRKWSYRLRPSEIQTDIETHRLTPSDSHLCIRLHHFQCCWKQICEANSSETVSSSLTLTSRDNLKACSQECHRSNLSLYILSRQLGQELPYHRLPWPYPTGMIFHKNFQYSFHWYTIQLSRESLLEIGKLPVL